jgi:hypothetical protein
MGQQPQKTSDEPTPVTGRPATLHLQLKDANNYTGPNPIELSLETLPRGHKGQAVLKLGDHRYRLRVRLVHFPRKATIAGHINIILLTSGTQQRHVKEHRLQEVTLITDGANWGVSLQFPKQDEERRAILTLSQSR